MTCEEFEKAGWGAEHDASLSPEERNAAVEHVKHCAQCAALEDSWRLAKSELRAWAGATEAAETPSRVEMRLRLEFRSRHQWRKVRRAAVALSWTLAAAAVVAMAVIWFSWRNSVNKGPSNIAKSSPAPANSAAPDAGADSSTLVADSSLGDFTLLPGSTFSDADDASVVRVRMQRGSLGALGLPVAEDRAADWVQVDLLVTDDGLPQAVRVAN